jgi:cytochrome c oxidase cbb3-type subunit I/II
MEPITDKMTSGKRHRWLEKRPAKFALVAVVAVLIGGLVEMIPTFLVKSNIPTIASVKPYTPLELQGRDLYIREACNSCHSQMVRPFRSETERYGEYSKAGEFVYDHPFLWGSKRTGPDLHRVGKKYPNVWHYLHMDDPRQISPGSLMPRYPWLLTQILDVSTTEAKINTLRSLGVPYPEGYENTAVNDLTKQAEEIAKDLQKNGAAIDSDKEIIALIAYLQRLGTDVKGEKTALNQEVK